MFYNSYTILFRQNGLRLINTEPYLLVPIHVFDIVNVEWTDVEKLSGTICFLRHCVKAELLPDPFRGPVDEEPGTKHV